MKKILFASLLTGLFTTGCTLDNNALNTVNTAMNVLGQVANNNGQAGSVQSEPCKIKGWQKAQAVNYRVEDGMFLDLKIYNSSNHRYDKELEIDLKDSPEKVFNVINIIENYFAQNNTFEKLASPMPVKVKLVEEMVEENMMDEGSDREPEKFLGCVLKDIKIIK